MDKSLGHKGDEKVTVAGDQSEYQQQQSSTLTNEDQPHKIGDGGNRSSEEGKLEVEASGGTDHSSRSIPPFTEGYGTTGGEPGEKHHGFANAV